MEGNAEVKGYEVLVYEQERGGRQTKLGFYLF